MLKKFLTLILHVQISLIYNVSTLPFAFFTLVVCNLVIKKLTT